MSFINHRWKIPKNVLTNGEYIVIMLMSALRPSG